MQLKKFLNKKTPKKDKIRILSKMLKEAEANGGTISVRRAIEVIIKDTESMQFKVYNEENKEVANDLDTALELLELNGYRVVHCTDHWYTSKEDLAKHGDCPTHNKR